MKQIVTLIAILFTLFSNATAQTHAAGARKEDEAAIRRIVMTLQEGWNTGSGKTFAAPFAEDADYVVVNGRKLKGRAEIDSIHQGIFDTIFKNTTITAETQTLRFIRDDVAIAHIEWSLSQPNDKKSLSKATNTLVMTKENGKWSIAAFQNTPIPAQQ